MKKLLAMILCMSFVFAQETAFAEDRTALPLPASRSVTLTLAEYDRLVDLAKKSAKTRELPPLPYALKRADMKLKVTNLSVLGTVQLEGEVFSRGATKVPLATGLTIINAHHEGKALPLEEEGQTSVAILPGQAEFSLTLDTGLQLSVEAGRASFTLPVPAAGSVKLALVIPGEHTNVRISPGLITSRTSENGQTEVEATLAPGQPANVWWATREVATPVAPREVRFLSDVKTLVSVTESEVKIAALADVTVVQGEPAQFAVEIPAGYEVTGATGAVVESSEIQSGALVLKLSSGAPRSYQFLISMERPLSATKADAPFLSFKDTQRETGEVLVEGAGAMELTATEGGGLKRMDLKEVNPYLRALSGFPLQAAFRYHRQPNETPTLALAWTRFPDSTVLAAVAESAIVTTLVTVEGRSLTEIKLLVKNHAQPFLKVDLPAGATILSAEVAGEKVKPVQGADGSRVPLLRAGFRPTGPYEVSFVFMHSGTPFAKKGGSELSLPSMDVPISVLQWEVFLPEQYKVKDFGGDTIAMNLLPVPMVEGEVVEVIVKSGANSVRGGVQFGQLQLAPLSQGVVSESLVAGQLGGVVLDQTGAVISGAQVTVTNVDNGSTRNVVTDSEGHWVLSGLPSGPVKIEAYYPGFKKMVYSNTRYDARRPLQYSLTLQVGATAETVEVTASAPLIETQMNGIAGRDKYKHPRDEKKQHAEEQGQASANVFNLQKRVAGVLPVRVDVPRAGTSYRFARALVLDEETKVSFNYKSK
jgi:hypothetical protein